MFSHRNCVILSSQTSSPPWFSMARLHEDGVSVPPTAGADLGTPLEPHGVSHWLVVWNMAFMTFHSVGNVIIPSDELIFFRGVGQPPTS